MWRSEYSITDEGICQMDIQYYDDCQKSDESLQGLKFMLVQPCVLYIGLYKYWLNMIISRSLKMLDTPVFLCFIEI